eukprot:TRINITY_DN6405_c0_g1_i1.p1 TRINITY_DN6405_c0_g1~~TRINITY_DN6405_c0_g1_i1.p1  ORF type:complete len:363 (+),score=57.39 TRINITY_DN6405_c0_g1_i1:235-1323(+)
MIDMHGADAGTGSPGSESVVLHQVADPGEGASAYAAAPEANNAVAAQTPGALEQEAGGAVAEAEEDGAEAGDLAEDADLCEYARTLGLDPEIDMDLLWVAQEAFAAPLPGGWAEYADETGRVYYFHETSSKTTWEHPMDEVFRDLLALVKNTRAEPLGQAQRTAVVREHLQRAQRRALQELKVWSGPYASEQGDYYYNEELKASTWESPITEWQNELTLRHDVLTRCLLGESGGSLGASEAHGSGPVGLSGGAGAGSAYSGDLLETLRLPLGLVRRESLGGEVPGTPSTSRTFYTARSAASSRSKHSVKSDKGRHKKERRAREHKSEESSRTRSSRHREDAVPSLPLQPPPAAHCGVFQAVD